MAWESSQELRPGSRTRHQRGLGFRLGTLCSRSPHLGALEYYGILVTVTAARTRLAAVPAPARRLDVFPLPPLRHALPARPPHAARCTRPPLGLQPRAVGPSALAALTCDAVGPEKWGGPLNCILMYPGCTCILNVSRVYSGIWLGYDKIHQNTIRIQPDINYVSTP